MTNLDFNLANKIFHHLIKDPEHFHVAGITKPERLYGLTNFEILSEHLQQELIDHCLDDDQEIIEIFSEEHAKIFEHEGLTITEYFLYAQEFHWSFDDTLHFLIHFAFPGLKLTTEVAYIVPLQCWLLVHHGYLEVPDIDNAFNLFQKG